METLLCARCDEYWERERASGRKPKYCPDCRAQQNAVTPPTQPDVAESIRSTYCSAKLHIICREEAVKFPDVWGNCTCACHK